jgi:hypothetical protein
VKKITLSLLFFLLFYFYRSSSILAVTLFSDNFDNPSESLDKWEILHYNPPETPLDGTVGWQFINGLCGVSVNNSSRGAQSSMLFPKKWDSNLKNYIFQTDFKIVRGVDSNLMLKFTDRDHWYGLHGINCKKAEEVQGVAVNCDPINDQQYCWSKMILETVGHNWNFSREKCFAYEYNQMYRIKAEIRENNIKISITKIGLETENVLWDVTSDAILSTSGKPGLGASTGSCNHTEVWFDNVLVTDLDGPDPAPTPTPTSAPSTVFIPGLGGSFSFKGIFLNDENANDWQLTPGAKVYDNILKAFDGDSNFYIFYYDWRKSVLDSAQKLNSFIEEKIGTDSGVNLIGHSLGGLVGRACIQKQNGCHASKLITVGSPHLGVVNAYPSVQGGEIWGKGISKLAFELLVHYYQKPGETRKDTIEREAPVLRELLPEFDYLTKNGSTIPWSSLQIKNSLLPQLSNSSSYSGITETLTGNNKSTLKGISVADPGWLDNILGLWPDGKPLGSGAFADEGDGTVLAQSASLANLGVPNQEFNLDHGEIISSESTLTEIFSLLGKTLPEKTYSSLSDAENYLVFVAHSPVELFSPQADLSLHLHPELIIIPSPENKQYDLQVKGIGNGSYLLSVGQIFGEKVIWNNYTGLANIGSLETFSFNISPENPLENPLIISSDSLKNLINQAINDLKETVNQEALQDYQKNFLLYYLEHIQTHLDNDPEKAIFYSNLFRDAVNFYQKSNVLSKQASLKLLNKTHYLSTLLESLAFQFPQTITEEQVNQRMNNTKTAKGLAENNVPDKSSALVYLQALEKLDKATVLDNLYTKYLLSSQAQFLFLESKLGN